MTYPYLGGYNSNFPINYQPYYNPTPMQTQPMQQVQQSQGGGIICVENEAEARAYAVAPLSSVLLMDKHNDVFYIKSADASGIAQPLRVFDFHERTAQTANAQSLPDMSGFATRQELEQLEQRFSTLLSSMNGQNGGNVTNEHTA